MSLSHSLTNAFDDADTLDVVLEGGAIYSFETPQRHGELLSRRMYQDLLQGVGFVAVKRDVEVCNTIDRGYIMEGAARLWRDIIDEQVADVRGITGSGQIYEDYVHPIDGFGLSLRSFAGKIRISRNKALTAVVTDAVPSVRSKREARQCIINGRIWIEPRD